ncbi:MAG: hypothetical protein NT062_14495 [Proteobacteria bacterium]|nr:hypothetical protein [Pseudomonadota bacterium]
MRRLTTLAVLAGCHPATHPPRVASPPGEANAWFRLEPAPVVACVHDAICEARIVVVSLGGYKVNAEYPTQFVALPSPDLAIEASTFAAETKDRGTMTIRFRPARPGALRLVGQFKFSVCTELDCQIAAPAVTFDVTAT